MVVALVVNAAVPGAAHDVVLIVALLLVLFALAGFVRRYARWATTNIVVTTDRLILRAGVLAKSGREIPLDRINDISFHQSLFERLIRAGDLVVESAGERGQETLRYVPDPEHVQRELYRQMAAVQERAGGRAGGQRELSLPEQLERLDELRQRGVITQAEFDAKKADLLRRL
jgi:uncharacterized membrane protein YdbT with pleckstrin-like domain